jgi:hypothetical protein
MSKRSLTLIVSAVIATLIAATGAAAGTLRPFELRGSVNGGASLQDLESKSYGAKLLPTVGGALSVFAKNRKTLNFGFELSYDHNFQSDDKNYYYYSSYEKIGFTPMVEITTPGRRVRLYALGGLGLSIAFSGYTNKAYGSSTLGVGMRFHNTVFHGILVSYSHGFLSDYKSFEAFKAGFVFRLLEKGVR